jgi:hypothetical protein
MAGVVVLGCRGGGGGGGRLDVAIVGGRVHAGVGGVGVEMAWMGLLDRQRLRGANGRLGKRRGAGAVVSLVVKRIVLEGS